MFLFKKKEEPPKKVIVRLDLAWRELREINDKIVDSNANKTTHIDLSNNKLTDISPLGKFTMLESAVLDSNRITDHTKMPRMEKLHTLWVNKNKIANLAIFIDKLVEFTPNLRHLSMLDNDACPNYFNGGSLKQYTDYRYYVLSRLRNLTMLDSSAVTEEEKKESQRIYGNMSQKVAREESEAKRVKEIKLKKKEDRLNRRKQIQERRKQKQEMKKKQMEEEALKASLPNLESFRSPVVPHPPKPKRDEDDWTSSDDSEDWSDEDL